jgi:serine/threonine protein phosphatase 1
MLDMELDKINFNIEVDRLFCVGDLVDRGPESIDVLDILAQPWFHSVVGNHDLMAIDYYVYKINKALDTRFTDTYIRNGGQWFIDLDKETQKLIVDKLIALPLVIEVESISGLVGIVHADCPFSDWNYFKEVVVTDNNKILEECVWSRSRIRNPTQEVIQGIGKLYHGHTVLEKRVTLGNRNYIDTGAVFGNKLTIEKLC